MHPFYFILVFLRAFGHMSAKELCFLPLPVVGEICPPPFLFLCVSNCSQVGEFRFPLLPTKGKLQLPHFSFFFVFSCAYKCNWVYHCQQRGNFGSPFLFFLYAFGRNWACQCQQGVSFDSPLFCFFYASGCAWAHHCQQKGEFWLPLFCFFFCACGCSSVEKFCSLPLPTDRKLGLLGFLVLMGVIKPAIGNRRGALAPPYSFFFLFFSLLLGAIGRRSFVPRHCQEHGNTSWSFASFFFFCAFKWS